MLDRRVRAPADRERKMQRAIPEIARLDFIVEPRGEGIVQKRAAHIRPLLEPEASLRLATKPKVAQFALADDPSAQRGPSVRNFPRFIQMKNKITVRLHFYNGVDSG